MSGRLDEIEKLSNRLNEFEDALKTSEKRYKSLSDATFEAIFISIGGCCIDANQSACDMFGYPKEEIMGKYIKDFIAEDERSLVQQYLNDECEGKKETVGLKKNGDTFDIEVQSRILKSSSINTDVSVVTTAVRDISDRKQARRDLEESERKFRLLYDNAAVGLFRMNMDGTILEWNRKMFDIIGLNELPNTIMEIRQFHKDKNISDKEFLKVFEDDDLQHPNRLITLEEDGNKIWAELTINVNHEQGYVEGVIVDVTEREKELESLRESKKRYEMLFDNSLIGVIQIDAETGSILDYNKRSIGIHKYDGDEVLEKNIKDIFENADEYKKRRDLCVLEGEAPIVKSSVKQKNGDVVEVFFGARLIDDGTIEGSFLDVKSFEDILDCED